ncbi:MAG: M48 family metallopeptidase [Odoribacteraceae bacterium]|jgi:heat shock protein HtpX|nr:M48 family metallopeptidase [Odoribacteraceae bacterium]
MQYVGIQTQQARNNTYSVLLLGLFPCLVVLLVFLALYLLVLLGGNEQEVERTPPLEMALAFTLHVAPYVIGGVLVWFLIAYFANTAIINAATGARPLERKENKRVYNLVENLCISQGMTMPRVNVIDDSSLNAYASGINARTYAVTLTRGIIEKLNDDELEGVIGHELSHIRHRDVRLLIISIVFVGIFAMLAEVSKRALFHSTLYRGNRNNKNNGALLLIILVVVATVGYLFANLMRFAISRKREYMADAGAAAMTRKPLALAAALRKISADPNVEAISRGDVAQLFIEHPRGKSVSSGLRGLFATHPPIQKRIEVLEQF